MTIQELLKLFNRQGCKALYAKRLAPNDNSKNQIYLGPSLESTHLFPIRGIEAPNERILKASIDFSWLSEEGTAHSAPNAQIVFYPQYPEVRFSGFKLGCSNAPDIITGRTAGRTLFLGVTRDCKIIGYVSSSDDLDPEILSQVSQSKIGVFHELDIGLILGESDNRTQLIEEIRKIHKKGWIISKQLDSHGNLSRCIAPQCGGLTLEAELNIPKNSRAEPDFLGYEIKQHSVTSFDRFETTQAITLMTPEPKLGYYAEKGVIKFTRRFGYKDRLGRPDRLNFGGIHKVGQAHPTTGLSLALIGYNTITGKLENPQGSLSLITNKGEVVAGWSFSEVMSHWTRKHSKACYIPSMMRKGQMRQYCYGNMIRIAEQTDFLRLLAALAKGLVYYDPGIKLENASTTKPKSKRRSQFRIASKNIPSLYHSTEIVDVLK